MTPERRTLLREKIAVVKPRRWESRMMGGEMAEFAELLAELAEELLDEDIDDSFGLSISGPLRSNLIERGFTVLADDGPRPVRLAGVAGLTIIVAVVMFALWGAGVVWP